MAEPSGHLNSLSILTLMILNIVARFGIGSTYVI